MPKIDLATAPQRHGSGYPPPYDAPCRDRHALRLGLAAGLTRLGASLVTIGPGAWSSQRHWHAHEDELVYVLEGELVLVEDGGETPLTAGDVVAWKAGLRDGHHLQNRSDKQARVLAVSNCDDADHGEYPDIDLIFHDGRYSGTGGYAHKDGTPY